MPMFTYRCMHANSHVSARLDVDDHVRMCVMCVLYAMYVACAVYVVYVCKACIVRSVLSAMYSDVMRV